MKLLPLLLLSAACASPGAAPVPVGPAPLDVESMDGKSHDLAAILAQGRQVALVFWQPWCEACQEEAPNAVVAANQRGDSTAFFGVVSGPDSAVDDARVTQMKFQLGLSYPQIRDRDLELTNYWSVTGVPTVIVLGSDAEVLFRGSRLPHPWPSQPARD